MVKIGKGLAGSCLALAALAAGMARPEAVTYEVDATHSSVLFKVRHRGVSFFYGRFDAIAGQLSFDPAAPEKSSIQVEVDAKSVDSKSAKLDDHIRSADFLEVEKHPVVTFKSKSVKKGKEADTYIVEGDFTLKGVTKTIAVTAQMTGMGEGRGGSKVIGFHTSFAIDRGEFGVNYGLEGGGLGREVELTISIEAGSS
jgi:polyisoprenoid-binding protein YceI